MTWLLSSCPGGEEDEKGEDAVDALGRRLIIVVVVVCVFGKTFVVVVLVALGCCRLIQLTSEVAMSPSVMKQRHANRIDRSRAREGF